MFGNTYELSTAGFLAAATTESRRLAGHVRLLKTAKARGNVGGARLALRKATDSADRIDSLLTLATEWAEMDAQHRANA
ncbi:hypothetical protein [Streptomyces sp. NPDC048142]|uniref:hypothetical protein n=1 Tax=Streptomyces sp. NPDC048142 TaxID=3365501 RepID=UPI0037125905